VADHDVLVRRNRHPDVDTIDGAMAVLRTRRDDGNPTPGNVVSVFLQPRHLAFNCCTDGLGRFRILETDLQRDLHGRPFKSHSFHLGHSRVTAVRNCDPSPYGFRYVTLQIY
jgi:hypothetical protein